MRKIFLLTLIIVIVGFSLLLYEKYESTTITTVANNTDKQLPSHFERYENSKPNNLNRNSISPKKLLIDEPRLKSDEAFSTLMQKYKRSANEKDRLLFAEQLLASSKSEEQLEEFKKNLDFTDKNILAYYTQANINNGSGNSFGRILELLNNDQNGEIASGIKVIYSGMISDETITTIDKFLSSINSSLSIAQQSLILDLIEHRVAKDTIDLLTKYSYKFGDQKTRVENILYSSTKSLSRK